MTWPNFLIIGANKGGTTSLHRYLGEHPDVFLSAVKEPMYFSLKGRSPDNRPDNDFLRDAAFTAEHYEAMFDPVDGESAVGEASTVYLTFEGAAANIAADLPDVRLLAVLRDPIDRAVSAYRMHHRLGMDDLDVDAAFTTELDALARSRGPALDTWRHYVWDGFYGRHLDRFLAVLAPEQLQVHLFEDLDRDPTGLLAEVFRFLGVDDTFVPDVSRRLNVGEGPSVELSAPVRQRLVDVYRSDIERLEAIIDRDLSHWCAPIRG